MPAKNRKWASVMVREGILNLSPTRKSSKYISSFIFPSLLSVPPGRRLGDHHSPLTWVHSPAGRPPCAAPRARRAAPRAAAVLGAEGAQAREVQPEDPGNALEDAPTPGGALLIDDEVQGLALPVHLYHLGGLAPDVNDGPGLREEVVHPPPLAGDVRDHHLRPGGLGGPHPGGYRSPQGLGGQARLPPGPG